MLHDNQTTQAILATLRAIARERLTMRQKRIMLALRRDTTPLSATSTVRELQRMLGCSPSTIWNNLRGLRRALLIEYGGSVPVRLTHVGAILAQSLEAPHA